MKLFARKIRLDKRGLPKLGTVLHLAALIDENGRVDKASSISRIIDAVITKSTPPSLGSLTILHPTIVQLLMPNWPTFPKKAFSQCD